MITQPTTTGKPPWLERQLPYGLKLLVTFGAALLLIVALASGITWLALIPSALINGPGPRDTIGSMVTMGLVITGLVVVSVGGLIALWPLASAPTSFKPSYGAVPATAAGLPFEVRYRRAGWGRMLSAKGTLRFDADSLQVAGMLTPSPVFQIGVLLVLTVLPIILLQVGLGIIPALAIAYYVGRKRVELALPYHDISDVTVKGCLLRLRTPGTPRQIALYVSATDGERLYRELEARYPAALGGWRS
jgi:hypothetical protein